MEAPSKATSIKDISILNKLDEKHTFSKSDGAKGGKEVTQKNPQKS